MNKPNDGGPLFPQVATCDPDDRYSTVYAGPSVRDYFAAHAPSMDIADICNVMGWPNTLAIGGDGTEADDWNDTVWSRWRDLSLSVRLHADATFRYEWADAMLAAREVKQ